MNTLPADFLHGKTVLIADDEADLRELLAMAFERCGCRALTAGNGEEALQILQESTVDAVVSDVRMPGADGIDLIQAIRNLSSPPACLIFISGHSGLTEERARLLGAFRMLSKPFRLEELIRAVDAGVRNVL